MSCRHITVMDQSLLEFHMTLWNEEIIQRAEKWQSRQTVIFFADVRLEWDNFRQRTTAVITSRTVVTENPKTTEALSLKNFAKTAPVQPAAVLDHIARNVVDADRVHMIMTTAQVLDKAYSGRNSEDQFTALMYANVTYLNLDGLHTVATYICSKCSEILNDAGICLNMECLTFTRREINDKDVSFDLRINLSDHRGTLHNCRVVSPTANEILGCSVKTFEEMSNEAKTALKWKLLLTRCEARILVLCPSRERPQPLISLLRCRPIEIKDVAGAFPIY